MPCSEQKARRLLAQEKAEIVNYNPFTIKLKYGSSGYTQNKTVDSVARVPVAEDSCKETTPHLRKLILRPTTIPNRTRQTSAKTACNRRRWQTRGGWGRRKVW